MLIFENECNWIWYSSNDKLEYLQLDLSLKFLFLLESQPSVTGGPPRPSSTRRGRPRILPPLPLGEEHTPLHGAAAEGHRETAELLLDRGAEVDARNKVWVLCWARRRLRMF